MTPTTLRNTLSVAFANSLKILIVGAPGVGKSDIVARAAADAGMPLIIMHPAISDPTDFKGLPAVLETNSSSSQKIAEFLPYGQLRALIDARQPTVCFIDDIGQAPHAVQAALMQLIQARCIDGVPISPHIVFCGATNDSTHMAGVSSLLEPVKSRWHSIIHLQPNLDDWVNWAATSGSIEPIVIAFIRFRGDTALMFFEPTREMKNTPSPRTVAAASALVRSGLINHEIIAGATGGGWASEFMAFYACWQEMPDPNDCIDYPQTARVPDPSHLSTRYAITVALSLRITAANVGAIIDYTARLGSEYQVLALTDAHRRDSSFTSAAAFTAWVAKNGKLLA